MLRLTLLLAALASPAFALTESAGDVVAQEVSAACGGAPGRFDPAFVVERDLDGDGKADLLIAHEGIECGGTGRSAGCGTQLCPIRIWLRRGDRLALAVDDAMGYDLAIGAGPRPEIRWVGDKGAPVAIRWDGSGFR